MGIRGVSKAILFDTDVLIDAGSGASDAIAALESAGQRGEVAISVVTHMELLVGCRNGAEQKVLDRFVERFDVLPLNAQISTRAIELLRTYRLSHGLQIADSLIAATALEAGAPLVSKNQRHFRFIDELQLLPYPAPFASDLWRPRGLTTE